MEGSLIRHSHMHKDHIRHSHMHKDPHPHIRQLQALDIPAVRLHILLLRQVSLLCPSQQTLRNSRRITPPLCSHHPPNTKPQSHQSLLGLRGLRTFLSRLFHPSRLVHLSHLFHLTRLVHLVLVHLSRLLHMSHLHFMFRLEVPNLTPELIVPATSAEPKFPEFSVTTIRPVSEFPVSKLPVCHVEAKMVIPDFSVSFRSAKIVTPKLHRLFALAKMAVYDSELSVLPKIANPELSAWLKIDIIELFKNSALADLCLANACMEEAEDSV